MNFSCAECGSTVDEQNMQGLKDGTILCPDCFKDTQIISSYSQMQAIEDGVLVEIFKKRWDKLTGGRPIVATSHIYHEISLAGLLEIWNGFVHWRRSVKDFLREEEQLFHTKMNSKEVWVIEDGDGFTLMYPEDY